MPQDQFDPESLSQLINNFFDSLTPLLGLFALASLPGAAEEFRKAFDDWKEYFEEQDKVLLAFMIQHGLIGVERHFTTEQLWLLVRWSIEHGTDIVNRRLPEFVSHTQIQEIVEEWEDIPYLMSRRQICVDGVSAYEKGMYSLVIPALQPLAEGLASEIIPNSRQTDTVTLASKAQMNHPTTDSDFGAATLEILEHSYYRWEDFSHPFTPEQFNRHRILHGRIPDYGTAANSIRAFLLVDTVADIWLRLSARGKSVAVTS